MNKYSKKILNLLLSLVFFVPILLFTSLGIAIFFSDGSDEYEDFSEFETEVVVNTESAYEENSLDADKKIYAMDKLKEDGKSEFEKLQEERKIRNGDKMTSKEMLDAIHKGEIEVNWELEQSTYEHNDLDKKDTDDVEMVYFLYNGYYYHKDLSCKGLKDCYDIKKATIDDILENSSFKPCNWCSK